MGKFARSYRKTVKKLKLMVITAGVILISLFQLANSIHANYVWLILGLPIAYFIVNLLFRNFHGPTKHINEHSYVVLTKTGELEHRHIAKIRLGRSLAPNEVVHHINGKKTDNAIQNLCVMDVEKHELFHSWLSWKRKKNGRYPSYREQERLLETEYGGTLLENVRPPRPMENSALPVERPRSELKFKGHSYSNDPMLQRKLFLELRRERKRLAYERKIPVYLIFHNSTLTAMSEAMPDSKHAMLEIPGVHKVKYEAYGAHFIAAIRKFKSHFDINQTG